MMNIELNIVNKYAPFSWKKKSNYDGVYIKKEIACAFSTYKIVPKGQFQIAYSFFCYTGYRI